MNKSSDFNVDALLESLFPSETLNDLFENRLKELELNPTSALEIIDIQYRALQGILNGTSKRVDNTNFIKLASFLKISKEKVFSLYLNVLEKNFPDSPVFPQKKIDFINSNFDLAILRKAGFIKSITDYEHIENKINSHFGFSTIFEYSQPSYEVAFSAGVIKPKNPYTRGIWIQSAKKAFLEIANPYEYKRENLINYFPQIRWQSTNVDFGLLSVIRELYKLGVTVFYQKKLPTLELKGATLIVNDKPCIVLTDYKGFYSTLWHTLCHELCHVLFDLDEIKQKKYHISEEGDQDLAVWEKEQVADNFAREYLFSNEKLSSVKPHINNRNFILEFADKHQIHPSFIYTYYAYEVGKENKKAWAKAQLNNPSFNSFIELIENPWDNSKKTKEHIKNLKQSSNIYN